MEVEIEEGRLLVVQDTEAVAYLGTDIAGTAIGQEVTSALPPVSGRFDDRPPGRFRWYVRVDVAGASPLILLMGLVENQPAWTNTYEGAVQCVEDLVPALRTGKCCAGVGADGTVELYNSDNELLGTEVVPGGDTVRVDAPDSLVTLPNGGVKSLPSGQGYLVPRTDELEWLFSAGDGGSATLTVDGRYADDYDVFTDDGSSGTVEIRINGGTWAVPSGVVTLAIGDTLEARRSVWSAQGWLKFERVVSV